MVCAKFNDLFHVWRARIHPPAGTIRWGRTKPEGFRPFSSELSPQGWIRALRSPGGAVLMGRGVNLIPAKARSVSPRPYNSGK